MKKTILLLITAVFLTSCTMFPSFVDPFQQYESDFYSKLESSDLPETGTLGNLFDYYDLEWDEVFYYGAYSYSRERIKYDLGIDSIWIPDSYYDGDWLLVFCDIVDGEYELKYLIEGDSYEVSPNSYRRDNSFFITDTYKVVTNGWGNKFIKLIN